MKQTIITICIVSFNGKNRLEKALSCIASLIIPTNVNLQVVFVDNASTDDTFSFVNTYSKEHFRQVTLIMKRLKKNNLGEARRLGYKDLITDFVITCDDDNEFPSDYLLNGLRYFDENPQIGVLGAQGLVTNDEISIPSWFDDYAYFFGCGPQANQTGNVFPTRNVVYGAGMWHRHDVLMKAFELGFYSFADSRNGDKLGGGEDGEVCWAIKFLGYEVWYADDLVFNHRLNKLKFTIEYRDRLLPSLSSQKTIYANVHNRIYKGEIAKQVRFFWVKETVYHLKYLLKEYFKRNKNRVEITRTIHCLKSLLIERGDYDRNINALVLFKQNCDLFRGKTIK
jgi:glycosyltransferase involved in cell wall biosynthesis